MNLQLSKQDILNKIKEKTFYYTKSQLIEIINFTKNNTLNFLDNLINKKNTGMELSDNTNPLLWEFGHVVSFWENKTLKLLFNKIPNITLNNEILYDSFLTAKKYRCNNVNDIDTIVDKYNKTINFIISFIESLNNNVTPSQNYLIMLSLLHNEMHNESFLFSSQLLQYSKPKSIEYVNSIENTRYIENIKFINITGGSFIQGADEKDKFTFDNEKPTFETRVNDFIISKYPINNYQYLQFIENKGYQNQEYWCQSGWQWIQENEIKHPIYWEYCNNNWLVRTWNQHTPLKLNHPVTNISWYEACAFCRWGNYRLPTESEWEFVATNKGTTKFPWGDSDPDTSKCNLNYKYNFTTDITEFSTGDNKDGVSGLIGNVWEWCLEPIYPYDGFKIDPVYREMSYTSFGYKRICRGGCWAVPDFLINSKYRNAQSPDCRIQYIGFRVCKL